MFGCAMQCSAQGGRIVCGVGFRSDHVHVIQPKQPPPKACDVDVGLLVVLDGAREDHTEDEEDTGGKTRNADDAHVPERPPIGEYKRMERRDCHPRRQCLVERFHRESGLSYSGGGAFARCFAITKKSGAGPLFWYWCFRSRIHLY